MFLSQLSQGDPADVSLSVLENRQNLGRTYRPVRTIQCSRRAVLPVDRLLAYVFTAWSRTARSLGRRTGSPSPKSYRWINGYDGLEVRPTRRSKRKLAAKPQATAFPRVQTSDSTKDSIEIKLPSGISILVPVSDVESISAILEQVA